jgi:hypothetical protein
VVSFDRETRAAAIHPSPCLTPIRYWSANGLRVLICALGSGYHFYRYDSGAHSFVDEGRYLTPPRGHGPLLVAADGSIAVIMACKKKHCSVALRDPGKKRWAHSGVVGAIAYRLLPGSRLLALVPRSDGEDGAVVDFVLQGLDGKDRTVASRVEIRRKPLELWVNERGYIMMRMRYGRITRDVAVGTKGELIPQ